MGLAENWTHDHFHPGNSSSVFFMPKQKPRMLLASFVYCSTRNPQSSHLLPAGRAQNILLWHSTVANILPRLMLQTQQHSLCSHQPPSNLKVGDPTTALQQLESCCLQPHWLKALEVWLPEKGASSWDFLIYSISSLPVLLLQASCAHLLVPGSSSVWTQASYTKDFPWICPSK